MRSNSRLGRAQIWVLVLVTASPGLAVAGAQPSGTPCSAHLDHPLFISEVQAEAVSPDPATTVTPEGAVFVEDGDELVFHVTVENRVPESCAALYDETISDELSFRVDYLVGPDGSPSFAEVSEPSGCGSLAPQQTCTVEVPLPATGDGRTVTTAEGYPEGEQRLRFTVLDRESDEGEARTEARSAAERVIVVEVRPDLEPSATGGEDEAIRWEAPEDPADRHTVYSEAPDATAFEVEASNDGSYPAWNPNGGAEYVDRPSFDRRGDHDLSPDAGSSVSTVDPEQEPGPACRWDTDGDGALDHTSDTDGDGRALDPGEATCSYRRGDFLDMPVEWQLRRANGGRVLTSGIDEEHVYSDDLDDYHDKDDAIAWRGAAEDLSIPTGYPIAWNVTIGEIDRIGKAGTYELGVVLDQDAEDRSRTPEEDEHDNAAARPIEILGADLRVTSAEFLVEGTSKTCTDPTDPCPAGSSVSIDPAYRNEGHDFPAGHEVLQRTWRGAVFIQVGQGNFTIPTDTGGDKTQTENRSIPQAGEIRTLESGGWTVPTDPKGGTHTFMVTLDDPGIYSEGANLLDRGRGRVAELRDDTGLPCPTDEDGNDQVIGDEADNTFCLTLYFEDTSMPEIPRAEVDIDRINGADEPLALAGETVRLTADVHDNALEQVTATLEGPGGIERSVGLAPEEGTESTFAAETTFEDPGDWTVTVEAQDLSNVNRSDPVDLEVTDELPDLAVSSVEMWGRPDLSQAPFPGNHFHQHVRASLANRGDLAVPQGELSIVACPERIEIGPASVGTNRCETIDTVQFGQMAAGASMTVESTWETADRLGEYRLCAIASTPSPQVQIDNDVRCEDVVVLVAVGPGGGI